MLTTPGLDFICEAHNGISARIVEEVGFKGIWASGLTISGSPLGRPSITPAQVALRLKAFLQ
ncbi:MAG: hypothetical protein ACXV8Q_10500 [Methylobacter sp.]